MAPPRVLFSWFLVPSRAPSPFSLQDKGESQPSFREWEASLFPRTEKRAYLQAGAIASLKTGAYL